MGMFKAENKKSASDLESTLDTYCKELNNYLNNTKLVFDRAKSPDKSPPYVLEALSKAISSMSADSASVNNVATSPSVKSFLDKKRVVADIKSAQSTNQVYSSPDNTVQLRK